MLACDLIMQIRASRTVNADQVIQLERMVFGGKKPGRDMLEMLVLINSYALRSDPSWAPLLNRAAMAMLVAAPEPYFMHSGSETTMLSGLAA